MKTLEIQADNSEDNGQGLRFRDQGIDDVFILPKWLLACADKLTCVVRSGRVTAKP